MAGRRSILTEVEMDRFREWLEILIRREKNQEKAGHLLGVDQTTVSKLKGKDIEPSLDRAAALARALGMSLDAMLGQSPTKGRSDPPPPPSARQQQPTHSASDDEWLALRGLIREATNSTYHVPDDVMAVLVLGQQNTFHLQENEASLQFVRGLLNVAAELRLEGKEPVSPQAILVRMAAKTAERVPDSTRERKGVRKNAPFPKRQGG
jgi:transcriptional regulator with XRE-family HTH domain